MDLRRREALKQSLVEQFEKFKREIFYHEELKILIAVVAAMLVSAFAYHLFNNLLFSSSNSLEGKSADINVLKDKESKKEKNIELEQIYVYIAGAVERPGVYKLKKGERLFVLLNKAIPKPDSAAYLLNQADVLEDGEMIYVPTLKEASEAGLRFNLGLENQSKIGSVGDYKENQKININRASIEELMKIPGIGPKTAEKIYEYVKKNGGIRNIEDLLNIDGIGEKKLEKIKEYVTL
ncbi:MAG: ComEA family DNA-binding protein [Actinobacteria bacterium]|nr:ComEA family DNA-binding protein [Actinomycetota bacterium]